jgi:hypothetical protein
MYYLLTTYEFTWSFEPAKMLQLFWSRYLSRVPPIDAHYLGELMAFQVKQTSFPILLSMGVTAMLTIMSLGAALG